MTDREKLVELLMSQGLHVNVGILADFLIANGVTVQQWIPVEEDLPKLHEMVFVFREGRIELGSKTDGDWWKIYGTRTKKVSHWMPLPLPKPPKA